MFGIRRNSIGIMPAGALGVAFYHHLIAGGQERGNVVFLDRPGGDRREHPLGAGSLHIDFDGARHEVPSAGLFAGGMIECYAQGRLPELILVAVNPDQIDALLGGIVQLLEWMRDQGALETDELVFPYFLFVSNGIYFNHARYRYVEMLERAVMEGLLPDLWPTLMPQLVCRLLRGPTMQSGRRTGSGPDAVYQPGHQGLTLICGGDADARQRVYDLLSERRLPVQVAEQSPVSVELRKALVNLICNLFGVIYSIEPDGGFRPRSIGEIIQPEHHAEFCELGEHLYEIGRAIHALPKGARFDAVWPTLLAQLEAVADHYASSVQAVAQAVANGHPPTTITPNEAWLLDPLKQLAADMQLNESKQYFSALEDRYRDAIGRLVSR